MEDAVRQRIKEIFKVKNISMTAFAGTGSSLQLRLSRQLNRGASITLDTVLTILDRFPEVSAEWLLRGRGEMFEEQNMERNMGGFMADYAELHTKYKVLQEMYQDLVLKSKK